MSRLRIEVGKKYYDGAGYIVHIVRRVPHPNYPFMGEHEKGAPIAFGGSFTLYGISNSSHKENNPFRNLVEEVPEKGISKATTATTESRLTDSELREAYESAFEGKPDNQRALMDGLRAVEDAAVEKSRRVQRQLVGEVLVWNQGGSGEFVEVRWANGEPPHGTKLYIE